MDFPFALFLPVWVPHQHRLIDVAAIDQAGHDNHSRLGFNSDVVAVNFDLVLG